MYVVYIGFGVGLCPIVRVIKGVKKSRIYKKESAGVIRCRMSRNESESVATRSERV